MYSHWTDDYPFPEGAEINRDHILPNSTWEKIGADMEECQKNIPMDFGKPPRDIYKYNKGFKAEEWMNWVALYSLVFLKDHMPPSVMSGWYQFVSAMRICLSWTLTGKNIQEIRKKLYMFYHHYAREYSGNNNELLSAHRIVFHYLLHVADSIQDYGPPWSFWQFPMESYCGMLIPFVRSKSHPYVSLTNQVKLREQLNHIQFNSSFTSMVRNSSASWVLDNILGLPDYVEELYWPKRKYMLDELEYRRLREHYATFHEIALSEVKDVPRTGFQYGRLRTKDGHILGSKKCRKYFDDFRRINHTVAAIMLIDRYAKYHKRPEELVEKELYAEVEDDDVNQQWQFIRV
ncbi:uncharacterized protein VTP21DRAFT_2909 [Calcarisporiella thermophila]|uniref:uncharacterized protein n=1 Tax=Calcarisporiella thermophila TaxID=911321 RepID=UPI0037446375